jgi:hypothetical protein
MKTGAAWGISPHMGWAAVASIAVAKGAVRVIRTDRIATGTTDDPETVEPYHIAAGIGHLEQAPPPSDGAEIVRRGLEKQQRHALASVRALAESLRDSGYTLAAAAILCGRGRNGSSLERILASHAQIHIAEGIAVRDALAAALDALRVHAVMVDRKTLLAQAAATLKLDAAAIIASLKSLRPDNGGPWRQEQKHAALAAWLALAQRTR